MQYLNKLQVLLSFQKCLYGMVAENCTDKELLVYHRRIVQEREEAAARCIEREEAVADGLNQIYVYTQVLILPDVYRRGRKIRKIRHTGPSISASFHSIFI